ncbi:putative nitrate/sulfonate/bicarbonate ABC transporter periplasmic binding protein [Gottschalkia acidurici 9a]|uniref:Nitrate/sulfonate/bicarbonate ABC transporter periplasmic binding protein n=1 Tax=Gottschalkia acidurici (strain ATCC 7906 / DSM 604 / BCRC 14475 / CIP 104303 / KCTC 5404 / NCIMB 10678 / 9a) TaxID=1128398 RepID=K0B3H5_GOTA9|nr:ABC transporter substrate-binding protein [Gottschalkia acidurici]AFS79171.1 putative nitrate/sulfonate/bicarbonate ABC transporter periplasmic binding protein [Gottschalkia acidurici 9a]
MAMKKVKRTMAVLVATSAIFTLAGCSDSNKVDVSTNKDVSTTSKETKVEKVKKLENRKIVVGQNGGICQSPLIMAYEKGYFKEEGLDVELLKGDYPVLRDGLATGRVDVSDGLVVQWLKPIQSGLDINFTLGIHTGCTSAVVPKGSDIKGFEELKGKTIGVTGGIGGGGMNFGYRSILRDGLDIKDYKWKDYPAQQLITALEKGEIQAAIVGDQVGLQWYKDGKVDRIRSSTHDQDYKEEYCCLLSIRGPIVREEPEVAEAITRAVLKGAKWVNENKEETAKIMVDKKYVNGDYQYNLELINSYNYIPSIQGGKDAVKISIDELKQLDLFDKNIDIDKETEKIFRKLENVE